MSKTNCPACGSSNTICEREFTNDSLENPEICVLCVDCGNTGMATFGPPRDITWNINEEEEEDQ